MANKITIEFNGGVDHLAIDAVGEYLRTLIKKGDIENVKSLSIEAEYLKRFIFDEYEKE